MPGAQQYTKAGSSFAAVPFSDIRPQIRRGKSRARIVRAVLSTWPPLYISQKKTAFFRPEHATGRAESRTEARKLQRYHLTAEAAGRPQRAADAATEAHRPPVFGADRNRHRCRARIQTDGSGALHFVSLMKQNRKKSIDKCAQVSYNNTMQRHALHNLPRPERGRAGTGDRKRGETIRP